MVRARHLVRRWLNRPQRTLLAGFFINIAAGLSVAAAIFQIPRKVSWYDVGAAVVGSLIALWLEHERRSS